MQQKISQKVYHSDISPLKSRNPWTQNITHQINASNHSPTSTKKSDSKYPHSHASSTQAMQTESEKKINQLIDKTKNRSDFHTQIHRKLKQTSVRKINLIE